MNRLLLILLVLLPLFVSFFACSDSGKREHELEIILVRIPPFYNPKLSAGENQCYFREFLFSDYYLPNIPRQCKGSGLANDDSLLYVSVAEDRALSINMQPAGDLNDTQLLKKNLSQIFESRSLSGVFEPGKTRVVKAVGIKVPIYAKYVDLISVARAVKDSGADPIVLLIDDHLPYQIIDLNRKNLLLVHRNELFNFIIQCRQNNP